MTAPALSTRRYTVADLEQFPDDGKRRELVDGKIVEWGVTTRFHGYFLNALAHILTGYVLEHGLGAVVAGDPLVQVQASVYDARGPDVAFYARHRIPPDRNASSTAVAPDLVIEVLSPTDRAVEVERKIADWLRAGVRLLWYVNPETGVTMVYRGDDIQRVGADDILDGTDVVPGFRLRIRDVLDRFTGLLAPEA
jgi:Uma2 family endonuclease